MRLMELNKPVRVAAVQYPPVFLNKEATIDRACELIREAGDNDADLIAFPETYIPTYPAYYTPGFESPPTE